MLEITVTVEWADAAIYIETRTYYLFGFRILRRQVAFEYYPGK